LEKRNSENRKCQKTNEKSEFRVRVDEKRLKVRTREGYEENVKCAHLPREIAVFAPGQNCNIPV
jgi:hypothetical protein